MNDDRSIFARINAHLIEGIMFHDQMYELYLFIRLYSFASLHKKQYFSESKTRKRLNKYFITHRNMLIEETKLNTSSIIPVEWYSKDRFSITPDDVRKATMYSVSSWVEWEKRTKELYTEGYNKLMELGFAAEADFILSIIRDVDEELAYAESLQLRLEAIGYDVIEILAMNK